MFNQGDRVIVTLSNTSKTGVVQYKRMKPPEFREVECYSVKLDGVNHTGTIVPASIVRSANAQV